MKKRRGLKLLLLLSSLTLLTGCDNLGEEIGNTIKENLFTNIYATLAQIVATVVLLVLIIVFAYKPARKFLDKRRELLDKEVTETKKKNEEADENISKAKVKHKKLLNKQKMMQIEEKMKLLHLLKRNQNV